MQRRGHARITSKRQRHQEGANLAGGGAMTDEIEAHAVRGVTSMRRWPSILRSGERRALLTACAGPPRGLVWGAWENAVETILDAASPLPRPPPSSASAPMPCVRG